MYSKVTAIVPTAGIGRRFRPDKNKSFFTLGSKPLVVWSLETLESVKEIGEIIPVLKKEDKEKGVAVFKQYALSKIKRVATGGKERQDSVYNGLKLIEDRDGIVLIHDGARPFIEKVLIQEVIRQMSEILQLGEDCDGITLGVPVKDTIKEVRENNIVKKTPKRDFLWAIQTPQVFRYSSLTAAFERATQEGFYATDDAALIERYGGKIKVIMGSYMNMKITTPEDLVVAEYLMSRINDKWEVENGK